MAGFSLVLSLFHNSCVYTGKITSGFYKPIKSDSDEFAKLK